MDEEAEIERGHRAQPRAIGAAGLVLNAASREKADAFLDAQIGLLHLEKEKLAKEDAAIDTEIALNLSHLKFRRFGDFTKSALEIATGLFLLLILAGIGSVIWEAANDHGLVIDAFKVPPDMAEKGMTGDVVASALLDHLAQLDTQTDSSRAPNTYSSNWGNDIKVEIPETGISVSEGYRFLANWLGHQTRITGEVYHTPTGIALVARVSGYAGARFEGHEADLDTLVGHAAENVYRQTQPYRYAIYEGSVLGNLALGAKVLGDLAVNGPDADRPWAYTVLAEDALSYDDVDAALYRARKAVALAPDIPLMPSNLSQVAAAAGHDEEELGASRLALEAVGGPGAGKATARSVVAFGSQARETIDEDLGDYSVAVAENRHILDAPEFEGGHAPAAFALASNLALVHDVSGSHRVLGARTDADMLRLAASGYGWTLSNFFLPQLTAFVEAGDWKAARAHIDAVLELPVEKIPAAQIGNRTEFFPQQAFLKAKTGDMQGALEEIGRSPLDCYLCLRLRGQIDATRQDWSGAAYWFARAVDAAPSVPFAYTNWGAMLLAKGDIDGAIVQFERAHEKGPHFADPLELWGEALMAKNRSDLALPKFEEADKYAPNWGRLHLKWGEALVYAGRRADAAQQFARAATLDLTTADRETLRRLEQLPSKGAL